MTALTTTESADLVRLEATIRSGLDTFYEVGGALAEIANRRLHRVTHESFADYCRDVWGIGPSRGYQLIAAARLVEEMSTNVETADLPKTEAQARELIPVPAEKRGEVMQEAAKLSAPKPPSAKDVATAAKPYVPMAERLERAEKAAARRAKKKYEGASEMADALTNRRPPKSEAEPESASDDSETPEVHSPEGQSSDEGAPSGVVSPILTGLCESVEAAVREGDAVSGDVSRSSVVAEFVTRLSAPLTVSAAEHRLAFHVLPKSEIEKARALHRFLGTFLLQIGIAEQEAAKASAAA